VKESAEGIVGAATSQHGKLEDSQNTEGLNLLTIKVAAKMRKDKMQQKNRGDEQLKLYVPVGEPGVKPVSGTEGHNGTGAELSSRLEQQRSLTGDILERVVDYGNIDKAYRQVRANQGSSGVDGMEVEELRHWLGKNIKELQRMILDEQYRPGAVRKVEIPKPNGGTRMLASLTGFIERKLKLKVNRQKSGVRHCSNVKFLGYTVMPEGKIRVADKSIERLKSKVKELTKRNRGVRIEQIVKELNAVIIGWTNYFNLANCWLANIRDLDGWIRRKLRCYRLKQCGRKYTIYKFLRSFDIPENKSWYVVMYSEGWWSMSEKKAVQKAMNLHWFALFGLQSLLVRIER
jgi:hypothetical protein